MTAADQNKNQDKKETPKTRHWYAVHTYSGYEDAVERYLKQRVDSLEMNDKIFGVIVPKERKIKIKNGKRTEVEEKIYPGYVLVDMILTDDSWYVVRNTPRVTGFVGSDTTTPLPLSQKEVDELMAKMGGRDKKFAVDLKVGDMVKITDGPFKDYEAKVSQVDDKSGTIKVVIAIFGRDTAVELDSLQVQKL
jgi:transcriptional antiterminator NusG